MASSSTWQIQGLTYFYTLTLFDTQDTVLSALLTPIDANHCTACLWEIAGL
jgi:hypothetical protein